MTDAAEKFELLWIPHEHVDIVWPQAMRVLKPAFERDTSKWTPEEILQKLRDNEGLLWVYGSENFVASAMVTWVTDYPSSRVMSVPYAGGNLSQILKCAPAIREYAEFAKCDYIDVTGRRGWVRALKLQGFREVQTTVRLSL